MGAALAILAAAVYSDDTGKGPVYDEFSRLHCPYVFPDSDSEYAGRLNESIYHLRGEMFDIRKEISAEISNVVEAQATACINIGKLIKDHTAKQATTAPME